MDPVEHAIRTFLGNPKPQTPDPTHIALRGAYDRGQGRGGFLSRRWYNDHFYRPDRWVRRQRFSLPRNSVKAADTLAA